MSPRYAIYFSPAKDSPWWNLGARWLGRDEFTNAPLISTEPSQFSAVEHLAITAEPRRYGFHATLKAPFRLGPNTTRQDLLDRTQALASRLAVLPLGPMQAQSLGKFVALTPIQSNAELQVLAADCVVALDDLRAPLSPEDLARRHVTELNAREMELLNYYGYPYVLERFRFHLSLTGPVDHSSGQRAIQAVAEQISHLNATTPLVLDRLCVFEEATPGDSFRRITDMELSA